MEKKQSSVEWIHSKILLRIGLDDTDIVELRNIIEQAKAMHKEEIENAFVIRPYSNFACKNKYNSGFEQYYNETFGGEDEH